MKKTLYLEKRGGDFYDDERRLNELSDVGNFRVGIYDYSIAAKNGRNYILEFGTYTRYTYRKTHKVTGKPLKHEIREIDIENALHIDTEFKREETREFDGKKFMCSSRVALRCLARKSCQPFMAGVSPTGMPIFRMMAASSP